MLRVYCAQLCRAQGLSPKQRTAPTDLAPVTAPPRPWRLSDIVWWVIRPQERLTAEELALLERVPPIHPDVAQAISLTQTFTTMVRERNGAGLEIWLTTSMASKLRPFVSLAESIQRDRPAVLAGLPEPWSTGQAEGQINRLKLLKRQMFGKAKLDLLKQRLLAT